LARFGADFPFRACCFLAAQLFYSQQRRVRDSSVVQAETAQFARGRSGLCGIFAVAPVTKTRELSPFMVNPAQEFEALMQRIRAGEPEAARELFELYGKQIQIVVRRRMSRFLRSQYDSVDFSQDAWASFFHIPPERITFRTPDELVTFLCCLAQNKLNDAYRWRRTKKRSCQKFESLEARGEELAGQHAAPSQFAIAEEQWVRLIQGKSPRVRRALEMVREGCELQEISQTLGVHPKKIQRLLTRFRRKLKSL
jgi:RNA polymerase sigma-70 factor (ECF subfamily)